MLVITHVLVWTCMNCLIPLFYLSNFGVVIWSSFTPLISCELFDFFCLVIMESVNIPFCFHLEPLLD